MNPFQKATKKKSKLRCAFTGPTGSGKTMSAIVVAANLGKKVALIDTERGSASKYSDVADFDVLELTSYEPAKYIKAMDAAAEAGYDVLVVDSLSHAWFSEGGILDQKDKKGGNDWTAWRSLTPQQDALTAAILNFPGHIICTMRSKMDRVQEKDGAGKTVIRKVGMAPIQRDGIEYEFDVIGELDVDHTLTITKTRCDALDGQLIRKPGKQLAKVLLAWLDQGVEERPTAASGSAQTTPPLAEDSSLPNDSTSSTKAISTPSPTKATADLAAILDLAEAITVAESSEVLAWATGQIGAVTEAGSKFDFALSSLIGQRGCQLSDTEWVTVDRARNAVKWLRTQLDERAAAKATTTAA